MPPLTNNAQLFPTSSSAYGYNSPARVLDKDLVAMLGGGKGIPTKGIPSFAYGAPSYKVGVGQTKPFRPGTNLSSSGGTSFGGTPPGLSGNTPVQGYNPMDNLGYESGTMGFGTPSLGDLVKDGLLTTGKLAAVGTGLGLAGLPELGFGNLKEFGQSLGLVKPDPNLFQRFDNWAQGNRAAAGDFFKNFGDKTSTGGAISSGISSLASKIPQSVIQNLPGNTAMTFSPLGGGMPISPGILNKTKAAAASNAASSNPGFMNSIGNFFNQSRSFIPGVSGTGASATGFGGAGQAGSGITSVGNVLGTAGGLLSLASFIDDPSLASGLGTLAGAGASGIGAFSGLATAAPWLAGAALVASLLMTKKPSNKTGYTSIDLDEFKPVSFGMEGKKYSKENVDQTMQIMEPIIPLIQEIEKQYGVDLQGDLQVNYGGRDGLAYNIGNRDVSGFRNRLDYFDGKDQSTRDGGSIYRKTFKGENSGKDFYKSLLGDLETIAKQKQADGGGIIDLANYRGVQRKQSQSTQLTPEQLAAIQGAV